MKSSLAFTVRHAVVPVIGCNLLFPVRRVYCVGQNYADHAKEMGGVASKTNPFFFSKPPDAVVSCETNHTAAMEVNVRYPPQTSNYQHEVELVVAIGEGRGGKTKYGAISPGEVHNIIYGYAVGLDLTRRDLQLAAKTNGKPWDLAKGADESAPLSAIAPVEFLRKQAYAMFYATEESYKQAMNAKAQEEPTVLCRGNIELWVNGECRQKSDLSSFVTPIDELLSILSHSVELAPGDLVFTGTPSGVSALKLGDEIRAAIEGVGEIAVRLH
ncbi:fumarylpyruvate hydrolase [Trypanosoma rangeli]|uniref:Fumarylpyruvate hydrolase n=1 Tax=Trypanosoma rangeli TaxID=5698 RepID=A0A3R7MDA1_TRYRA|nr:fumarylpyruvate hydrolase [Trypanosoma rangeli]RNF03692.1 fumarylpyruvate hydrolase [Trypanosoma rangeli]|eukprot:RNF03692.1 fumarylpyruvate hydrolase [Trypanosoma rangeli]